MAVSQLLELVNEGQFDAFEARCLEMMEGGGVSLKELVAPFQQLERRGGAARAGTLAQMLVERAGPSEDALATIAIVRVALSGAPESAPLRKILAETYAAAYADSPGFLGVLRASGLESGRPLKATLKLIDFYLTLKPGAALISRADDRVVEVTDVDRENGLVVIRRGDRTNTVPVTELTREYDLIDPNDFRALRQLHPSRLTEMLENDPVSVVTALLHAHGESMTAEQLKGDLSPRFIAPPSWAGWWTKTRALLKRAPNVLVEGRSPVVLTYSPQAVTLEDEVWRVVQAERDAAKWQDALSGYLREKAAHNEPPDAALLERCCDHILKYIHSIEKRRPAEALACAIVLAELTESGAPVREGLREAPMAVLRDAEDPARLLQAIDEDDLLQPAIDALRAARPDAWFDAVEKMLPRCSAAILDYVAGHALEAGHAARVQIFIDRGLADLARHPEVFYWLWKGPRKSEALQLPSALELFNSAMSVLAALTRVAPADKREHEAIKQFRARTRAALALRDYAQVRKCFQLVSDAHAITLRRQFDRLEGVGDNMRSKLLELLRDVHPQLWAERPQRLQPWEEEAVVYCTHEGLRRRTAERDDIVNVQMRENAKRIGEAASHGDLSENSEYKFALEERDLLRARLARVNDDLSRAQPIRAEDVSTDYVSIGSRVRARDASGAVREMTFLGPFEGDVEHGVFSYKAPLSQKLMGLRVGDRTKVALDGHDDELEILEISNALK